MFNFDAGGTVFTRANRLAANDGMVGFALDALKEAAYGEHADRLLLVEYEALVRAPRETVAQIYAFLDEVPFTHDFDNVVYDARDFDVALGMPGLHDVERKVTWKERPSVLPPELFARFANDAFWRNGAPHRAKVIAYQPAERARQSGINGLLRSTG